MSTSTVPVAGEVVVGGRSFTITELPLRDERALIAGLDRIARETLGPGGLFARFAPRLEWLRAKGLTREASALVETLARMELEPASGADLDAAVQSAKGVALELYYRTRKAHPETKLEEFQAVVTDVNALDLHWAIRDALSPKGAADDSKSGG